MCSAIYFFQSHIRYGAGPHQVELQVQLPSSSIPETIKIELAPLELMPHSVHAFLEQIKLGIWDNTEFNLHAGHVLMAHSSSSSGGGTQDTTTALPRVIYPEYSGEYPHDKYTLAFPSGSIGTTNSRGGVDFYINLQDNTRHHSPRIENKGSDSQEVYVEGEPCFGKIMDESSRSVVDKMDALKVIEGGRGLLEEVVIIKSARII